MGERLSTPCPVSKEAKDLSLGYSTVRSFSGPDYGDSLIILHGCSQGLRNSADALDIDLFDSEAVHGLPITQRTTQRTSETAKNTAGSKELRRNPPQESWRSG